MTQPLTATARAVKVDERTESTRDFVAWRFLVFMGQFWRSKTRKIAILLTLGLVASVLLNIALQYGINRWNRYFFDAIGAKDVENVSTAVGIFIVLALIAIGAMAGQVFLRMSMQAHWRRWLTTYLAGEWLRDRQFYKLHVAAPEIDNPEFRMTDDVRQAVDPLVDFATGLLDSILMAGVFGVVLWHVGGAASVFGVVVPGYFLVAAALYGLFASSLTYILGRPLIASTERKNAEEARSRFQLVRIRENAESIAMIGGADDEKVSFETTMDEVIGRWRKVIAQQSLITLIIHANTMLVPVLPLLIGAPKYLAGGLSLGELMQISTAFLQVQFAFNWLVGNFFRLAEWSASAQRVDRLAQTLRSFSEPGVVSSEIEIREGEDARLKLINLSVAQHDGRVMIEEAEVIIEPGEKVMVRGESGVGKSTLIRAIAGLWPWGKGIIVTPRAARISFVPQRPYIPDGSLRNALAYPESGDNLSDHDMKEALIRCGLRHLAGDLERAERWDKMLSGGEQQRFAFARLVLQRPEVIILDEATSALDEDSQANVMSLFLDELSYATMLSVSHRPEIEHYHDRVIDLTRRPGGAHVSEDSSTSRKIARLLRRLMPVVDAREVR